MGVRGMARWLARTGIADYRAFEAAWLSRVDDQVTIGGCFSRFIRSIHAQKKQANDVRIGNVISLDNGERLVRVTKCSHVQGAARQLGNVQIESKDLATNAKVPLKYKTKDVVDVVRLEERMHQYLYEEKGLLHFMDSQFNQVSIQKDNASCHLDLLKEGDDVKLEFHGNTLISVSLPLTVSLVVSDAPPNIKNATQQPQYKPIVLETGARILAPPYIKKGDTVLVDTITREFLKRI